MHNSAIRPPVEMASRPALRLVPDTETDELAMWHTTLRVAGVVLGVTFAYAILRYVVLGTVQAVHVPLYILNKATAFTSLTLMALTLALSPILVLFPRKAAAWGPLRKGLG